MATVRITLTVIGLLAFGAAFASGGATSTGSDARKTVSRSAKAASAPVAPGPGRMQVEEPKTAAPLSSARESKAWQKNHARGGLTDAQKQAFRDRKEKMEGMIAVIKEKRKAMAAAKPEERAVIARELHSLMLEKESGPGLSTAGGTVMSARTDKPAAAVLEEKSAGKEDAKKSEAADTRRKQAEVRQQEIRKEEIRKLQLEKLKSLQNGIGKDNDEE